MGDGRRGRDCASLWGADTADRPRAVDRGSQTVDLGIGLATREGSFDREEEEEGGCAGSSEAGGDPAGEGEGGRTRTMTTAAAGEEEGAREGADVVPKPKDDPKYEKYRRMMRMGLMKETARHAMIRDNLDPRCVCYASIGRSLRAGASARPFYFDALALYFNDTVLLHFRQHFEFGFGGDAARKPAPFFRRWTRRWERRRGSRRGL